MKHTKILATISDRKCDIPFLKRLYQKGLDGVRINTAHQMPEDTDKIIHNVKKVSEYIPIIIDTKGPEVRTITTEDLTVKTNQKIIISDEKNQKVPSFQTTHPGFIREVTVGKKILIDDGDIELEVMKKDKKRLHCKVLNNGVIKNKKSINVPNTKLKIPSLSKKDKLYLEYANKKNVDFIAHSFVRNKEDVLGLKKHLNKDIKIIAKIENQEGVNNIDEILEHVYGIMIARGDLAIEIPAEKIPGTQKAIVKKCIEKKKLVITATQMLHSMIKNPRPTRAEVSDVANAIYDGTDVLMLSGETAYGDYPENAVETMTKVSKEVEGKDQKQIVAINDEIGTFLALSAMRATKELPIKAIIGDTLTGRTARYLAAFRGHVKIFMQCYDKRVCRELSLSYGIRPNYMKPINETTNKFVKETLQGLQKKRLIKKEDLVLVLAGNFGPRHGASFIEISKTKNLLKISKT